MKVAIALVLSAFIILPVAGSCMAHAGQGTTVKDGFPGIPSLPGLKCLKVSEAALKYKQFTQVTITGGELVSFLGVYNEQEPKTDIHADLIIAIAIPEAKAVDLLFFTKGCNTYTDRIAAQSFGTMLKLSSYRQI